MSKVSECKKLIAEEERKVHKPTISHYRDNKENPGKKDMAAAKTTAKSKKRTVAKKRTATNPSVSLKGQEAINSLFKTLAMKWVTSKGFEEQLKKLLTQKSITRKQYDAAVKKFQRIVTANPAEPTATQTEKVFTYWRKPKNFRSREWLEKELGQLRLFNYNTRKINYNPAQLRIENLPGNKFGVYLKSQLLRQSKNKGDMQSYLNALKNRAKSLQNVKSNPGIISKIKSKVLPKKEFQVYAEYLTNRNQPKATTVYIKAADKKAAEAAAVKRFGKVTFIQSWLENPNKKTVKKKAATKKNPGLIETAATLLVGSAAGLEVYDRLTTQENKGSNKKRADVTVINSPKKTKKRTITKKSKVRPNPVFDAFESFQGRKSDKTFESPSPVSAPDDLWALGELFEIYVVGHGLIDYRKEANGGKKFYLCADEQNKNLYITGGKSFEKDNSLADGYHEEKGEIKYAIYETLKAHLDNELVPYKHPFGDEGGERPKFGIDKDGFALFVGGDYEITPLGIRN